MKSPFPGSNRTFMELKSKGLTGHECWMAGSNRTFMELKYISN